MSWEQEVRALLQEVADFFADTDAPLGKAARRLLSEPARGDDFGDVYVPGPEDGGW